MPWWSPCKWWEDDENEPPDYWPEYQPTVTEADNPVIAWLYAPDGTTTLLEITERPTIPFGYHLSP